jgi:hypothetical protein
MNLLHNLVEPGYFIHSNCQLNIVPWKDMKILLQHRQTLQYVRTVDSWTKDATDAYNFMHSQKAIDFAHEHDLTDVYVAVKFLGGEPDVVALLPDNPQNSANRARF